MAKPKIRLIAVSIERVRIAVFPAMFDGDPPENSTRFRMIFFGSVHLRITHPRRILFVLLPRLTAFLRPFSLIVSVTLLSKRVLRESEADRSM